MTDTMNAVVATSYGNANVLVHTQVAKPAPAANEVLVRVIAASATRADTMMLTGKPYISRLFMGFSKPKKNIPGTGFAGAVVAVGDAVGRFQIGDEVFGETTVNFSSNAEYLTIAEDGVILHKPSSLGFAEAATFCDGPLTSINFLKQVANVQPGQNVLIIGASGSLGSAAVQLARNMGASVTGVCSTANTGLVKSLGASHVIDYTQQDVTQLNKRYDVIYDTVGKSSFGKCKRILTDSGQYVSPVLNVGLLLQVLRSAIIGNKKARFSASGLKPVAELRTLLQVVTNAAVAGKLTTIIDRQYPLEKVAAAHRYIAGGHKKGNVVIMVAT